MDQLALSGHAEREEDLDRFAQLGIQRIRYPVLWERTAPLGVDQADWSWADARLQRLKRLGLPPIVGLVHHGSGPHHTQLDSPGFAPGVAEFAAAVARRFPWVDAYTPINEPLTTARFSGLYGHWYPHRRDEQTFARALLNQCRATVLAMRAIREVNPQAKLVQTEDIGKTYSTPALAYQAEFENERRWLSLDLLTGKLSPDKRMWQFLTGGGVPESELAWFLDNPCPPDIVGLNYYVIGERFLDERIERYPETLHGGNHFQRYADVEAVRVRGEELAGWRGLLLEASHRYQLPLAVTEVHLNCHREAQLAWLGDAWQAAGELRREGIDVRAVTVWSLLGAYNWNTLVTRDVGHYEPGAFDVTTGVPRPTALARSVRSLADGQPPNHPAIPATPWWRAPSRWLYPPVFTGESPQSSLARQASMSAAADVPLARPPLLITGGGGALADAFARACRARGLHHFVCTRQDLDISESEAVRRLLSGMRPWAVINAAGYARVEKAQRDRLRCLQSNTIGPENLAKSCSKLDIQLLTISSHLVFDGSRCEPYLEEDAARPLSVYGQTKAEGERRVLRAFPEALVVRACAFFGPWDEYNFLTACLRRLVAARPVRASDDRIISPTYLPDFVDRCLDLLIDGERGLWHVANEGNTTWADFARCGAAASGLDPSLVRGCSARALGLRAPRPRFSALGSQHGFLLPNYADGIRRYCQSSASLARQAASREPSIAAGEGAV